MNHDIIIVGSGAGGSAAAYHLAQNGLRVLLLERGPVLPKDGSTLDVEKVFGRKLFIDDESWLDGRGRTVVPQERSNLGGKTKWYGAALIRFAPAEFGADAAHQCAAWPLTYEELAPFYDEAEHLLGVRQFEIEPQLQEIVGSLRRRDAGWSKVPVPLALAPEVLDHPDEAKHFDAFASPLGLKGDGEKLLDRVRQRPNLQILTGKSVSALLPAPSGPRRVAGVQCADGTRYESDLVILAGGALHSPRLLQRYYEEQGLASLAEYRLIGRNYKSHLLTAMLAFSLGPKTDVLRKTAALLHSDLPHSSVQPLGWTDGELFATEAPALMPRWLCEFIGTRVYGFFLQTEDGSHFDNHVLAQAPGSSLPLIDYDPQRLAPALAEHQRLRRKLARQLLAGGYLPLTKTIPLAGTAHACGTLMTGRDPALSVVDPQGRVHGLENLYVADGSVLPRSSRVNPALTIYAWALRLASLISSSHRANKHAGIRRDSAIRQPLHAADIN